MWTNQPHYTHTSSVTSMAHPSTTDKGKQRQPPVVHPASGNTIIINPCQRLNPIVECIRNVPKEFGDILPDYQVGKTTGVLFLRCPLHLPFSSIPPAKRILHFRDHSLRYHRLHPEYIHQRIERLGQSYNLRILLLMCDIVRLSPRPLCPSYPLRRFLVRTPRTDSRAHEGLSSQQHHSHRSLVVSPLPSSTERRAHEFTHTFTQTHCCCCCCCGWCWCS